MSVYHKKKFLIILISPSGGGKSTIGDNILENSNEIEYSVSYTTRKPRFGEKDGIDYFFVSESEFLELRDNNEFLESAKVHGNWYGTSRTFIEQRVDSGKHILLDLDIQGANQIVDKGIDAVTIFIIPPTEEILKDRLAKRGSDSAETIKERLKNAEEEIARLNEFQYLVINEELSKSILEIKNIISAEENKVFRYKNINETFYGDGNE